MKTLRILIADDHDLIRRGVRGLFQSRSDWKICGEAATSVDAVSKAGRFKPDVILLDVNMPGLLTTEAVRRIRAVSPDSEIIILTLDETPQTMRLLFNEEICGYVFKSDFDAELITAVEEAARHHRFFTSKVSQTMFSALAEGRSRSASLGTPLTPRQADVVRLLAEGKSNKEVADALGIRERTAEAHRAHIMAKLGFKSFSELVRYAVREQIIKA
jgi:DNA-binding NarL/FixJ family response regulator